MIRQILFLGSGSPFMVNAVIGNLSKSGYEVTAAEPNLRSLGRFQGKFDAAILFLGDALLIHRDVLRFVGDLCAEEEKPLLLIGTGEELEIAGRVLPEQAVTACFEKPLNIKDFLDRVAQLSAGAQEPLPKQILLVDDDPDYLKLVSRWLSAQYRVTIVNSGAQAIAYLGTNKPDLILLDYSMPVVSGPQVLEMLRSEKSTAGIPVIFLTGKDDSESVNRVLELRPNGYILKSVSRSALLERLEEFFAGGF